MEQSESSAIARAVIGVAVLGCYVGAVTLWIIGARQAFSDCDSHACKAFGLNVAKAVAFDYVETQPEAILLGLFIFVILGGCIVATIARALVSATASSARAAFSVVPRAIDPAFTTVTSLVVLSVLIGIYYGAQRGIPPECCPHHDPAVPGTTIVAFVLAGLPALAAVTVAVANARQVPTAAPEDGEFSLRLLRVS